MTQSFQPVRRRGTILFLASAPGRAATIAGIVAATTLVLAALGRPLICPCGAVMVWQGEFGTAGNSQQFADWYSFLHVIFGLGLFVFVNWLKPRWPLGAKAVVATAGSAAWEIVENLPVVIALFNPPELAPSYTGDSILNSSGDTLFVLAGFLLADRLPVWAVALLAVVLEILVSVKIDDGLAIGTLRIFGAPI